MLKVSKLRLLNFRSHLQAEFDFSNKINAIIGANGSGKTTILEAVYTMLNGTSFRGPLSVLINNESQYYKTKLFLKDYDTEYTRGLDFRLTNDNYNNKKWLINDKTYSRLPANQRIPCVLFEPETSRLLIGGPDRRRQYLDTITGQLDPIVAKAQHSLDRAIRQRNSLLKTAQNINNRSSLLDSIFPWNAQIAKYAESVVNARLELVQSLSNNISEYYQKLGGEHEIELNYASTVDSNKLGYGSSILKLLEQNLDRDIILKHTTIGPHRDDLSVFIQSQPASIVASRGELRTIIIALKMLETEVLAEHFRSANKSPVLLLDDVLGELDIKHQEKVLEGFKDYQVFVTTTDAHAIPAGLDTLAL